MLPVRLHQLAYQDIIQHALFIGSDSDAAATRFVRAVHATNQLLSQQPEMGSETPYRNPALQGMRQLLVNGFPNHLIFYLRRSEEIEVLRVLHGAQNLKKIFREWKA